ncbi:MAG: hypothetical protein KBD76_13510 [Bacteriovorax sp.]|nr:hypothetical protein [Bacteriovorax sp.]
MEHLIEKIEGVLRAIRESELRENPKASAMALGIRKMIDELKMKTRNSTNQGVLKYIHPKALLEN